MPHETGVAIIAMAGRFPGAPDLERFWANLREGVESISPLSDEELLAAGVRPRELERPDLVKASPVLEGIELFDAEFFGITPREAQIMDPQQRLLVECAWEALERGGYAPERFSGSIGVFAGSGINAYLWANLVPGFSRIRDVSYLEALIGNEKDYLTTRISYTLGLTGPSINVQTACSTGLVAVHLAVQALLDYHCDMALAGGVRVNVPQKSGYHWEDGGITSPDGHCRPYDAGAAGTVFGSGVGLVLLKRLDEAIEDGDHVHAVIRGTAVNNDGSRRAGFTAPGVQGQMGVIAEALAAAGVDADSISYVEGHGTATPLGDPIEVEALSRVFSRTTSRKRFCGLGSVKGNVGHLDAAAGIAGLVKTALALERGEIPPSLHFERPNPQIDLDGSPFYVNDRLRPWTSEAAPRRAGVSSFGIGGTNAHVVLEEAPPVPPPVPAPRPWLLLPLSARTPAALERATAGLAGHLERHPEVGLADVAYTLQVGRRRFEHRAALLCPVEGGTGGAALRLREAEGPRRPLVHHDNATSRRVGFLLSGQGSQHPGMGEELYRTEAVFRRELDRAAEILEPLLDLDGDRDLRRYLYPDASTPPEVAAARLRETALAQPALFAVSWAAAKLWQSWGIQPDLLLGHSLGEWVAASLAGVFSLPDALELVAVRARLMQERPGGAMLAVPLSEEEVAPLLGPGPDGGLELAAVNGPRLAVVTGEEAAIERCRAELAGRGLAARRLHTSHAFHSRSMDAVVEPFRREVERRRPRPPELPFVSNVTGEPIRPEQATDPAYWAAQLRRPVRFAAGLEAALSDPGRVLVEVGPGRALATLARRHPAFGPGRAVLGTLPAADAARERDGSPPVALESLARLWLLGAEVHWEAVSGDGRRRVALPTYPFERRRYWIDPPPREAEAPTAEPTAGRVSEATAPEAREAAAEPAPGVGARPLLATPYVAPRDETEERVAGVWRRALGIEPIGAEDDFFELGGHSLLATRVAAGVRRECGVEVSMKDLFEVPTVEGMARAVEAHRGARSEEGAAAELPRLVPDPAAAGEPFPLTDVQEAYWLGRGDGFELGRVATHSYFELEGPGFELDRLSRALDRLIERHGALRTVLLDDGRQRILQTVPGYEIGLLDLSGEEPEAAEAGLAAVRAEMSHQVLPADRWPLFEIRATRLPGDRLRLHVSFDFLIGDAWSVTLVSDELARLYLHPETELPPLELTFRDYVLAERELRETPLFERALEYWRLRLPTLPPAPELPLARDPGSIERARFERLRGRLGADAWSRIKERAQRRGVTPSGLLLTAFSEVLAAWAKSPRFILNLTLFNRLPLHPQVDRVAGDFTSLTLLEVEADGGRSFAEAARAVQRRLWDDLDHRWVSGVRVLRDLARLRREGGRAVAPVVFTSTLTLGGPEPPAPETEAAGTAEEAEETAGLASVYSISQTPQVWLDHQVSEIEGGLRFTWDVVGGLFPEGMVEVMFAAYLDLLERLADPEVAWEESVPVRPPASDLAVQAAANATEAPPAEGLLHAGFFARAAERPERLAVVSGARRMSYGELAARATALGRRLREAGVVPGELVGVVMSKGWEQVAAVLGVLAAGGAYLPVGAELPEERRRYLLEHGRARFALTQPRWAEDLAWPDGVEVIAVDSAVPAEAAEPLEPVQTPAELAYVIFTSGSTGHPKGVMIEHGAALNTVVDVNRRFSIGPQDRVLGLSSLSFDLSVWDVFGTLAAGGTLVLPEPEANRDPVRWLELLEAEGVSVWNTVPALLEMLVEYAEGSARRLPGSLRLALLSGDWIPLTLPDRLRERAEGRVEVVSLGGATEASIWSILFPVDRVEAEWRSIPYGRPMANQTFRVLGPGLSPRPVWAVGELWIGGAGLARGYWRDEEKTAASFVEHPHSGERLYRTGDLGRFRPDGTIEFLAGQDPRPPH
jgi:amino acid adenylation domain-containing protein